MVTIDEGGNYSFYGFAPGDHTLTVTHGNYTFTPPSRVVTVGSADLSGQDFSGTALTYCSFGTVRDKNSIPISGVVVSDGAGHSDLTDSSGAFMLSGVAPGDYTLVATKDGYLFTPGGLAVEVTTDIVAFLQFTGTELKGMVYLPFVRR